MEHKPADAIDEAYRQAIKALRTMRTTHKMTRTLLDEGLDSVERLDANTQAEAHRAFISEVLEAMQKSQHQHFGRTWPW